MGQLHVPPPNRRSASPAARWGAGTLHILAFVMCIGVALPALDLTVSLSRIGGSACVLQLVSACWYGVFGIWVALVLYLLIIDPSVGQRKVVLRRWRRRSPSGQVLWLKDCPSGLDGYIISHQPDGRPLHLAPEWQQPAPFQQAKLSPSSPAHEFPPIYPVIFKAACAGLAERATHKYCSVRH